jgi:hypothetical protein
MPPTWPHHADHATARLPAENTVVITASIWHHRFMAILPNFLITVVSPINAVGII